MPKTKFGVGSDVSTKSGFGPYEGPLPKPGVYYDVELKQCAMKISQAGNLYVNTLWEVSGGECEGYPAWHRVVPGESEIQKTRVAQFMQAVCGKNEEDIVHDNPEDGGKVTKIGSKNPIGTKARMTFQRKPDTRNAVPGEEPPMIAEPNDLYPLKDVPKQRKAADSEDDPWATAAPASTDDDEVEEEEGFGATYEEASKMSLKELKALGEDWGIDEEDLPKTKAKALAHLVEEGIVEPEQEGEDEEEDEVEETPAASEPEPESTEDGEDDDEDSDDEDPVSLSDARAMSLAQLKALAEKWEVESDLSAFKGPKGKKALIELLVSEEVVEDLSTDEPPF